MDTVAHRLANALVGNDAGAATLECTVVGPELAFDAPVLVALSGAVFDAAVGSDLFPQNRPVLLAAGARLRVGNALRGARGYLAIAGGWAVPPALGSRSTYVPAAFGGFQGRALRPGDIVPLEEGAAELAAARFAKLKGTRAGQGFETTGWRIHPMTLPTEDTLVVSAMSGRHAAQFDSASIAAFYGATWKLSPDSNRMGYRLVGPALIRRSRQELLSEPTCLGTVQAPSDGNPIVLMADHQTTGGYPKIAEVAGTDIALLAQLAPGAMLRFTKCTVSEAREGLRLLEARIATIIHGIEMQYGN
jgi:antagonist of KipI